MAWWTEGFTALGLEGFRTYLHEMVGLGVLAPNKDGRGWHLRSPNVLRMIGSPADVEDQLLHADAVTVPSEFIAMSTRRPLPDGTRSPLTSAQIDDLLGDHNTQARLVLGSHATGVERVSAAMNAVCADLAGRYTLVPARTRKDFEDALRLGEPGQRRVVLSDLRTIDPHSDSCSAALRSAVEVRPTGRGVTRSAVLVSGANQIAFWMQALGQGDQAEFSVVSLQRFDRRTLRVWSLDTRLFTTDERRKRLLDVTGGWPILVDRVVTMIGESVSEDAAMRELDQQLRDPATAANLIDDVGLTQDTEIGHVFDHITTLVDSGAALGDLLDAAAMAMHPEPAAAVACLQALGVFDLNPQDGTYRVDPLLVRCWPYRRVLAANR